MKKKFIVGILSMVLLLSGIITAEQTEVYAKTKEVQLSRKKVTVVQEKTKTIRLKNVWKKVSWKVIKGKKVVKIVKKSGKYKNTIKLKGLKEGKAVIRAKYGKKTYKVKITVKKSEKNSNEVVNPQETMVNPTPQETTTTPENPSVEPTTPEEKYATVSFVTHGLMETEIESISVKIGEPYGQLPEPITEKYWFMGWSTEYYNGTIIKETDICTGDIVLYAKLYPDFGDDWDKYYAELIFAIPGEQSAECIKFHKGEPYGRLPEPEKEGYTFLGWYTEEDGGTLVKETDICTETMVVYARFAPIEEETCSESGD